MQNRRILVVDDEESIRTSLATVLKSRGHSVGSFGDGASALAAAIDGDYDLLVVDLSLPQTSGLEILREVKAKKPDIPVIVITGFASPQSAVEAMKLGAYDYLTKPFDLDEVEMIVERALDRRRLIDENRYLREEIRSRFGFDNLIGENPQVQKAYVTAAQVAQTNATVLCLGETGTGKEFLARFIHYHSRRAEGPFVKVNCAALPETLLESELFGHEKGAFTNAIARRAGRFEIADGGTIFLDEIGDITPAMQAKLLRVLQEKQFERVGGEQTITSDVRVIAATNRNLQQAVRDKEFREDLYYRLNVITITLPPLRERPEDIPLFARHFMEKYAAEFGKPVKEITPDALAALSAYSWPGNIRELENCIERAVILTNDSIIDRRNLHLDGEPSLTVRNTPSNEGGDDLRPLSEVEKDHIKRVLDACEWNQSRAAAVLGIDRKTLRNKLKLYALDRS